MFGAKHDRMFLYGYEWDFLSLLEFQHAGIGGNPKGIRIMYQLLCLCFLYTEVSTMYKIKTTIVFV